MKTKLKRKARKLRLIIYQETLLDFKEHGWTFVGSFTGIALIGLVNNIFFDFRDNLFLIGSFGASSVLIYGVINSPFAQPRNLIGGHVIGGLVGVTCNYLVPSEVWLAAGLSVSCSIVLMQISKTLHPPGGATALLGVIGSDKIKDLGYLYVLSPILSGVLIMLIVALVFNNITVHRSYPANKNWYKIWKRRYG